MNAASHIGTTSATHIASSSPASTQRDADAPSFSESLTAASKASHVHADADHATGNSTASKKQKDSSTDTKTQAKHPEDITSSAAPSPIQAPGTEQTPVAIALPVHIFLPQTSNEVATSKSDPASAISSDATAATAHDGAWAALNSSPSWSPTKISTPLAISGQQPQAVDSDDADQSDTSIAPNAATPDTQNIATGVSQDTAHTPKVSESPVAAEFVAKQDAQPSADSAQATAVQSQVAVNAAVNQQANAPQIASPAISTLKATNALKGLQGITSSAKNTNPLSNPQVAGAKQTDSYLSIQKNAKGNSSESSDAKESQASSLQHATKDTPSQEQITTPAVAAQVNHTPASFDLHQHKAMVETSVEAPSVAAQDAAGKSLEAQANRAAATAQTSSTEMASAVVNSAKLIQSISQSEMQVGMRTADFGDISIRTSSTRDSISAQISLAHSDLAQTLTAHLPEMQTRLSSGEVVDVHIHHDGQASDFNSNSGGTNQGGAQGQNNNESTGRTNLFGNSYTSRETAINTVPSAVVAAQTGAAGRLDIRA